MFPSPTFVLTGDHVPPARVVFDSRMYDFSGAVSQFNVTPPPGFVAGTAPPNCRRENALVGLVPARYSTQLGTPSPSGSALSAANGLVTLPKKAIFHSSEVIDGTGTVAEPMTANAGKLSI